MSIAFQINKALSAYGSLVAVNPFTCHPISISANIVPIDEAL